MSVNVVLPKLDQKNNKKSIEKTAITERQMTTERYFTMDLLKIKD